MATEQQQRGLELTGSGGMDGHHTITNLAPSAWGRGRAAEALERTVAGGLCRLRLELRFSCTGSVSSCGVLFGAG